MAFNRIEQGICEENNSLGIVESNQSYEAKRQMVLSDWRRGEEFEQDNGELANATTRVENFDEPNKDAKWELLAQRCQDLAQKEPGIKNNLM